MVPAGAAVNAVLAMIGGDVPELGPVPAKREYRWDHLQSSTCEP